jgi:hypothetical protein
MTKETSDNRTITMPEDHHVKLVTLINGAAALADVLITARGSNMWEMNTQVALEGLLAHVLECTRDLACEVEVA